jgi:hypothetical protein
MRKRWAWLTLEIVDAHAMKMNPLEVPRGVSPHSFAPNLADALVRVLKLPPTAQKVLHQSLYHLYQKHGILDGDKSNYPTLFELRDFVANAKQFHTQARDAFVTSLDPLLLSLKNVFCYRTISQAPSRKGRRTGYIDLLVTNEHDSRQLVIEIEMEIKRVSGDVQKRKDLGDNAVLWIVTPTRLLAQAIRKHLKSLDIEDRDKIFVFTLAEALQRVTNNNPFCFRA